MTALSFELHKLGWRAFQDLCGVVLQQTLGQVVTPFADSNDAGQDGAFHGSWRTSTDTTVEELEAFTTTGSPVVIQCKFSSDPTRLLSMSDLTAEVEKARNLHERGQCDAYLVMSNQRVSGQTHADFVDAMTAAGIATARILPGSWICDQIERDGHLRRYLPRVYGLGDLGRILDDRRLRQAKALLTGLSRELETFVPTEAYRRASDALTDHGYVLLLGEPASGKSTIAAMLSMSALDNWGCAVKRVDGADELVENWDPDDPTQLFWVDDAFGSIRHDPSLTDGWARRMDQVMAAVEQGAKVLLTSRDYIYRQARPRLKEYAYPKLREQVVVDVSRLSREEKRQIMYNHLKVGDQPAEILQGWTPFLPGLAALDLFQPELARRLSQQDFTRSKTLDNEEALLDFFRHPQDFLLDVLQGLESELRAALACVYLAGGELMAPVALSPRLQEAVIGLGSTGPETIAAFARIDGTFLSLVEDSHGNPVWRFKHPTIREGFAAAAAGDMATLTVYIDGMTNEELVKELDCGGDRERGTLVRVPPGLYELVASRIEVPRDGHSHGFFNPTAWFLRLRCSDEFLRRWTTAHEGDLDRLANFGMFLDSHWQPALLARLHRAGALHKAVRRKAVARLIECALDFDPGWAHADVRPLFTPGEFRGLKERLRTEVVPSLETLIDYSADGWDSDTTPESRYRYAREAVEVLRDTFADEREIVETCKGGLAYIAEQISNNETSWEPPPALQPLAPRTIPPTPEPDSVRDPFDDVAEGH